MYAGRRAHDRVTPSEQAGAVRRDCQFMTKRSQLVEDRCGDQRFDIHVTTFEGHFAEPSGFERLLNVEIEIRDIGDELRMRLRLIESSHDSKADPHAILFHEARNDGVEGTLAGR